jgi:hypothetical protein
VLVNVNVPDAAPATVGMNCTFKLAVLPAFNVRGKVAPDTTKPAPVSVAAFTVTDDTPVDDRVSVCVADELTSTLPKLTLDALTVRMEAAASRESAKLSAVPPELAVRMTVCAVVTAVMVALKLAVVAPSAIVTVAGTDTAELLLVRATVVPPLPAAVPSVTVHASVVEPITVPLAQFNELSEPRGEELVPVPERAIASELESVALLETVRVPVFAPIVDGLNWMVNVNVLLGLTLTGSELCAVTEKAWPATFIDEIVTGAEPELVTVIVELADWPRGTEPNATDNDDGDSVPGAAVVVVCDEEFETLETQPVNISPLNSNDARARRRRFLC